MAKLGEYGHSFIKSYANLFAVGYGKTSVCVCLFINKFVLLLSMLQGLIFSGIAICGVFN